MVLTVANSLADADRSCALSGAWFRGYRSDDTLPSKSVSYRLGLFFWCPSSTGSSAPLLRPIRDVTFIIPCVAYRGGAVEIEAAWYAEVLAEISSIRLTSMATRGTRMSCHLYHLYHLYHLKSVLSVDVDRLLGGVAVYSHASSISKDAMAGLFDWYWGLAISVAKRECCSR